MQIAVIADIHDNLWNLAAALQFLEGRASTLLVCGDLCSPFVIDQLARFRGQVHLVFGNNDADLFRITSKASALPHLHLHGELCEVTLENRRFAVHHYDTIAKPLAQSGNYDVVCFGHNHELEVQTQGKCLLINPGPLMGARFPQGKWHDCAATFALYDTASHRAEVYAVDMRTRSVGSYFE